MHSRTRQETIPAEAFFARHAATIADNGFSVVAIRPRTKKPRYPKWHTASFQPSELSWIALNAARNPDDSVALGCGRFVIAIDIDAEDREDAARIQAIAERELGSTPLMRVGKWPKRALLYRSSDDIHTRRSGLVEIIGRGGNIVAFGIHPEIKKPYYWIEDSPTDTDASSLPQISADDLKRFLTDACQSRLIKPANDNTRLTSVHPGVLAARIVRDSSGIVVDGREAFLTLLVLKHASTGELSAGGIADGAWAEFEKSADLSRPNSGTGKRWSRRDAFAKARATKRRIETGLVKIDGVPARRWLNRGPATHLHSHRAPGYWTDERKSEHQARVAQRRVPPSVLKVNQAMLDFVPTATGQCIGTVAEIEAKSGICERSVQSARSELVRCGFWVTEWGVYVPQPLGQMGRETTVQRVQGDCTPLLEAA